MLGICTKCHALMPLTRHHIKPRSKGGGNESDNIRLCCRPCHDELDAEAGVRPGPAPDRAHKRSIARAATRKRKKLRERRQRPGCTVCGNSTPKQIQIGIMSAAETAGLCQRCAWQRERNLWHELRESLQKKIEETTGNQRLERLIRDSKTASRDTVH